MRFFISAGEPSGDIHAAGLIEKIREHAPDTEFVGFGGPKMKEAGCQVLYDLTKLAVMWFFQALTNYLKFRRLLKKAEYILSTEQFDAVILVDYPGFNWHIAHAAKENDIPVYYFMPPQVWAWAQRRVKKMRKLVNTVLAPLPFEYRWFNYYGCKTVYTGHPFFEEIRSKEPDAEFLEAFYKKYGNGPILTVLPGSRYQEVKANLD
ncbi:MAG: lipid-A-disaccharide synthase, partial [Planctomycetaceae bacterium]|nr:lipid-A-disaccharide synthase [Planctomycetaceae bacterium]